MLDSSRASAALVAWEDGMSDSGERQGLRIFVSHSHKDDDFGMRLVGDLRAALGDDAAVWYDASGGLRGGDAWWRRIVRELTARPVFIVILSPDALASPWVNDEIDLAWKQKNNSAGKLILPVVCRPCIMREDLTLLQHVSFVPPLRYEDGLADLLAALGLPLGTAAHPAAAGVVPAPAERDDHDDPTLGTTPGGEHELASRADAGPLVAVAVAATDAAAPDVTAPAIAPLRRKHAPRTLAGTRPRLLALALAGVLLLVAGTASLANATGVLRWVAVRQPTSATHGPSPTATFTATRGPTPTPTLALPAGLVEWDSKQGWHTTQSTFRLGYPSGWSALPSIQITPAPPLYWVNFNSKPPSSNDTYAPFFQVFQSEGWATQTDPAVFANEQITTANGATFSKQTLDGVTCSRGDEVFRSAPGAAPQFRALICRRNGTVYLVFMECNTQTFAQTDATYFEPMLRSFQFLPR